MAHPRVRVLLIIAVFLLFYVVLFWAVQKWTRQGQQRPAGPESNQAGKPNAEITPAASESSPLAVPGTSPPASPAARSPSVVTTSPSRNQAGHDSGQAEIG